MGRMHGLDAPDCCECPWMQQIFFVQTSWPLFRPIILSSSVITFLTELQSVWNFTRLKISLTPSVIKPWSTWKGQASGSTAFEQTSATTNNAKWSMRMQAVSNVSAANPVSRSRNNIVLIHNLQFSVLQLICNLADFHFCEHLAGSYFPRLKAQITEKYR